MLWSMILKRVQTSCVSVSIAICIIVQLKCLFSIGIWAQTNEAWVAKVISVEGNVQERKKDRIQWGLARSNNTYYPGDAVRVQERSRACILLSNEIIVRLDQNTTITFIGIEKKQIFQLDVLTGAVYFITHTDRDLKISTPFVNATIEGTEFLVKIKEDQATLTIFEGRVLAMNAAGSLTLVSGQSAIARAGKAPVPHVTMHPRRAVQWALYYPPVVYYREEDPLNDKIECQEMFQESIRSYRKGDITNAFSTIENVPRDIHDPRFFNYRAMLFVTVGRAREARSDIEQALNLAPGDSTAIALQSIIAMAQNEKEKALVLAQEAVRADTDSAAAYIALSYAYQRNFNSGRALESIQQAVKRNPENVFVWVRLSELWLLSDNLDKALESAEKAAVLNPQLARTQIALGYVYLTQIKVKKSLKAFEKAIEVDPADPLAWLGLGLVKVLKGKLKEGRREMGIAVSLDPNRSVIGSYLSKECYDKKWNRPAKDQFHGAKKLDPVDSTTSLYSAVRKQIQNRPVEALQDLQKAFELNDSRAVYRSNLLHDGELEARIPGLSQIYNDLGFEQLALAEGWKLVNTHPGNYSAHRFLADLYSSLSRHDIARASEFLQYQLLQPINIPPVQPQFVENNLFVPEGTGPENIAFNESDPVFNRDRFTSQISSIASRNKTLGEESVQSGIYEGLSYSIGQFHYETNGFYKNDDQEMDIYNIFTQIDLSHKTSIQTEFQSINREVGDLPSRFDPDLTFETLRQEEITHSARLGFHHTFTQNSDFIASLIYQDEDLDTKFTVPDFTNGLKERENAFMGEFQHLFQYDEFNIISGTGYYNSNIEETQTITFPLFPTSTIQEFDVHHNNFYLYTQITFPESTTWTLGGSADFFEGRVTDRNQFNPKFGLSWDVLPQTTFRTAIFRTLTRPLATNQTIEPTQVAGFNQLFDEPPGTDAWRYGIAVDQKFSQTLYGGIELSKRELEVPFLFTDASQNIVRSDEADWKERLGRAYFFWTPHSWLATSIEFFYERLERYEELAGAKLLTDIKTFQIPLGINLFHPSGFIIRLKSTYINREGDYGYPIDGVIESGKDQFWVFNASVGYRLPGYWGLITVEGKNLLDGKFQFQDTDPANILIIPERLALVTFTLIF